MRPEEIKDPNIPWFLSDIWEIFFDLSNCRRTDMGGHAAISWTDIDAYSRVMDKKFTNWEIRAIQEMDKEYLAFMSSKRKAKTKAAPNKPVSNPAPAAKRDAPKRGRR